MQHTHTQAEQLPLALLEGTDECRKILITHLACLVHHSAPCFSLTICKTNSSSTVSTLDQPCHQKQRVPLTACLTRKNFLAIFN